MTTKSERRAGYESKVEQDERLAGKHIKTLLHLQDLHSENDLLKARIAELELHHAKAVRCDLLEKEVDKLRTDLAKCEEYHQIAKDSKESLQQMQQSCLRKIDDTCASLTETHKAEIMRIVSEKLEAENSWVLERQELIAKNEALTKEIRMLQEENESLKMHGIESTKLSAALQEAKATIESFKQNSQQLKQEKAVLEKTVREFCTENESLSSEVDRLRSRVAVLEMQSKLAQATKVEIPDNTAELANLQDLTQLLEEKNKSLAEQVDRLENDKQVLEYSLQDSSQALKHAFKERDLLKNRITGLLKEVAALKSQTQERSTFADFVHLKRDYNTLKDEHDKLLKRRSSKTNVLPTLKSDSSVGWMSSRGSLRSGVIGAAGTTW
ncbi:PREDICTED: uncharacterized protein PFB0145c-like [Acropora digitifera]|uniref:uncharacterized protein PFB0145c-like n=1 Tax=Acropora digitifera TaxID=70779 RepID=UPI00077A5323|nr:PREDICTED: uncharacterized protein PFB0145c-like [Acropora digitifera]